MLPEKINFQIWRDRVLQLRRRRTQSEDIEFCNLVEQVDGINEIDIIRTLLETFTAMSDTGVEQTVVRVFGSFDILLYYQAYLEALPRLISEGAEWEMELGAYPERDPSKEEIEAIAKIVKRMPDENKNQFLRVLKDGDFDYDHDWAKFLVQAIRL